MNLFGGKTAVFCPRAPSWLRHSALTVQTVVSQMRINIGVIVISVKNAPIDSDTLTFQPQNHITSRISQGHSLHHV